MKGESVLYALAGVGLILLLFLCTHWLGPLGAFTNMLAAFPVAYLTLRFGLVTGGTTLLLAASAVWFLAGLTPLISYLGLFGAPSLCLPWLLGRAKPWDLAIFKSTLVGLGLAGVLLLAYLQVSGQTFGALQERYLQAEIDLAMQTYTAAGLSDSQLAELKVFATQAADFIRVTFVGLYVVGILAIHAVTLLVVRGFKGERWSIAGVAFAQWHLPPQLVWVLIAAGFALLVPLPAAPLIGRNLLAVLLPLYFVQGLAVLSCFLHRKKWSSAIKWLVYFLVFILNPLPLLVVGVGIFDLWIDFRRPRPKV